MEKDTKKPGHIHPLSLTLLHINKVFTDMGFSIATGPEIETEFYNFDALNIPEYHPARDMWDTFWLKPSNDGSPDHLLKVNGLGLATTQRLLRTHTSPVQIHYMQSHTPPIRIIAPGKCFRHEATDATHEAQFFQVEALVVGEDISVAHLKGTLEVMFEKIFEKKTNVRLRPSYFPFVKPGFETDMSCFKCEGQGLKLSNDSSPDSHDASTVCSLCKGTGWIELGGSGLVHPTVLQNAGIDPKKYSGFAFGYGVDRIAMLKYGIEDIRLLYHGDLRLVNQF